MDNIAKKLTIELVPSTCWFSNVRNHVNSGTWDRLRHDIYKEVGDKCAVCGGRGPKWAVECHELWEYDDESHIQKLVGLTGLCHSCHEVKHMGFANIRGRGAIAKVHLAYVNGWTAAEAKEYVAEAFLVWRERSKHEWALDMTWLERLGVSVESERGPVLPAAQKSSAPNAKPFCKSAKAEWNGGRASGGEDAARMRGAAPPAPSFMSGGASDLRKPSEVTDDFWVNAKRRVTAYPPHTERGGKWLVFVPTSKVDGAWEQIKAALEIGELGEEAKVSTARPNANAANPAKKVICVYTYDGDDEADVRRVRNSLRHLGFTEPLSWKPDQATREGQYQVRGHTRVSRYWE